VSAVTRMMGLILAVIGVQMFIEGAHGAVQLFH
jgi:small neutral amino acid transporter SnatA (MarC family)